MSWQDAHRYNQALRTAERDLNLSPNGYLRWRPEYAEIFGSPRRLLLALRSRWETTLQAQIDRVWEVDGSPSPRMRELVEEHPGLVRAVARLARDQEEAAMRQRPWLVGAA